MGQTRRAARLWAWLAMWLIVTALGCGNEVGRWGGAGATCVEGDPIQSCAQGFRCVNNQCRPSDQGGDMAGLPDMTPADGGDMGAQDMPPGEDMGPCGQVCPQTAPHCDTSAQECVACVQSEHCTDPVQDVCDVEGDNTCVDCLAASDCTDPTASHCDLSQRSCEACDGDPQCSHLEDTPYCEEGTCVACRPTTEAIDCKQGDDTVFSCDPATFTCTTTEVGSLPDCGGCVSDSECKAGYGCVPMEFKGQRRPGGYCLPKLSAQSTGVCPRPYVGGVVTRTTLSGVEGESHCGIVEGDTTCEAIHDRIAAKPCVLGMDSACGADGLEDGLCRTIPGEGSVCTYLCSGDDRECTKNRCVSDALNLTAKICQ